MPTTMNCRREFSGDTIVAEKLNHFEHEPSSPPQTEETRKRRILFTALGRTAVVTVFLYALVCISSLHRFVPHKVLVDNALRCTTSNLQHDLSFLKHAVPISNDEFLDRRDRLANALVQSKIDAFVLEPGYTSQYYANISQIDWEPWEPEERPFLMITQPQRVNGSVIANTTFLAPSFEVGRVKMLGIPSKGELDVIPWEEHEDPYAILYEQVFGGRNITVMIDEELRDYISRGLQGSGLRTVGVSQQVEEVRQIKSPAEVELLRAVNTGTVQGIRAMQPCLKEGLRERDLIHILDHAMKTIGFQDFFNIVLFDENAALPHGGFATGDKVLNKHTMILIDVGYHYLGYSSDVCRSFFMKPVQSSFHLPGLVSDVGAWWHDDREQVKDDSTKEDELEEKKKVWDVVLQAQSAAGSMFKTNNSCASVDLAARGVIDEAGYNGTFTHRVGHGIGIKAHESPYLNKANTGTLLKPGMTFTNEPGIYLEGKFGVRHEDIYLVTDGEPEVLSGKRARGPYDP
ncbi:peptidase M24, structural domain-containing protein [Elsinoe ampelina]|uniref:Peptidase M24, structural domain-containing protein n=1 Tax=Elsinoe ampelina TaxID=302913 RepID=A0A6A6FZM0_9PEZI|nr:peptidase M24, structural domain-containing protein [Elsinoe ampelina]